MKQRGILITEEYIESLRTLPREDLGILMRAILDTRAGDLPDLSGCTDRGELAVKSLYTVMVSSMERIQATSEKRAEAGKQGGRPKKAQHFENDKHSFSEDESTAFEDEKAQTKPNHTIPNDIEKEEPTAPRKSAPRFTPPTVDQVAAYAREKGLLIDAQRFCDFYASKGWKVGKEPMKDWQAAARNWASRDKARGDPKPAGPDYKTMMSSVDYGDLLRRKGGTA